MTFAEAMAHSLELELAALEAIRLKLSAKERRAALSAYIQFNPCMYQDAMRTE